MERATRAVLCSRWNNNAGRLTYLLRNGDRQESPELCEGQTRKSYADCDFLADLRLKREGSRIRMDWYVPFRY